MSNSVARLIFSIFVLVFLLYSVYWKKEPVPDQTDPIEVICISEVGDTVARYKTNTPPKMWEDSGISCAKFEDIETGKTVEIRTRTGTIVCQ